MDAIQRLRSYRLDAAELKTALAERETEYGRANQSLLETTPEWQSEFGDPNQRHLRQEEQRDAIAKATAARDNAKASYDEVTSLAEFRSRLLDAIRSVDQSRLAEYLWPIGVEWDARPKWTDGSAGCLFVKLPRHEKNILIPNHPDPFDGDLLLPGFLAAQSSNEHPYCRQGNDTLSGHFWGLAKPDPYTSPTEYRDLEAAVNLAHCIRDEWARLLSVVTALKADDSDDGHDMRTPTWCHSADAEPPDEYQAHGPYWGNQLQLTELLWPTPQGKTLDRRRLQKMAEKGVVWVKKRSGQHFEVWIRDARQYAQVNSRWLTQGSKPTSKWRETGTKTTKATRK